MATKTEIKPDNFYTVESYYLGGGVHQVRTHVKGSDVARCKRALGRSADEGERMRYVVLDESAMPARRGEFTKPLPIDNHGRGIRSTFVKSWT